LREGIETNQKRITFPVTLSGELFYSKEAEIEKLKVKCGPCIQWMANSG